MDLHKILQRENYDFDSLIMDSKAKFDWHIDKLQLGSQLLKVTERQDIPRLVGEFNFSRMEKFYKDIAKGLSDEIMEE